MQHLLRLPSRFQASAFLPHDPSQETLSLSSHPFEGRSRPFCIIRLLSEVPGLVAITETGFSPQHLLDPSLLEEILLTPYREQLTLTIGIFHLSLGSKKNI